MKSYKVTELPLSCLMSIKLNFDGYYHLCDTSYLNKGSNQINATYIRTILENAYMYVTLK